MTSLNNCDVILCLNLHDVMTFRLGFIPSYHYMVQLCTSLNYLDLPLAWKRQNIWTNFSKEFSIDHSKEKTGTSRSLFNEPY